MSIISIHFSFLIFPTAVSPYFEQIFDFNINNSQIQKQFVVINEIPYDILQHVLEFAYKGRVSVDGEDYEKFCKAAKLLKLKGIADKDLSSPSNFPNVLPLDSNLSGEIFPTPPSTPLPSTSPVIQDCPESPALTVKSEPMTEPRKVKRNLKRKVASLGKFYSQHFQSILIIFFQHEEEHFRK